MMIATILLVLNLVALIYTGSAIFSFLHFIWIYPLEISIYFIFYTLILLMLRMLTND